MQRRAELVEETRRRIVEAAVRLHTTVGPANTSIAGVAEAAGVTRLTVYRHFPDLASLFAACSAHWAATHPAPDAAAWPAVPDVEQRLRAALRELYRWYDENGAELLPIHRDVAAMPATAQAAMRAQLDAMTEALIGDVVPRGAAGKRLRAAARHLLSVPAWHALAVTEGLGAGAADLAADMLLALQPGREASEDPSTPGTSPPAP